MLVGSEQFCRSGWASQRLVTGTNHKEDAFKPDPQSLDPQGGSLWGHYVRGEWICGPPQILPFRVCQLHKEGLRVCWCVCVLGHCFHSLCVCVCVFVIISMCAYVCVQTRELGSGWYANWFNASKNLGRLWKLFWGTRSFSMTPCCAFFKHSLI